MASMFLKIETIPGECADDGHEDEINAQGYEHTIAQTSDGEGGQGGRFRGRIAVHNFFCVKKELDFASAKIAVAASNGSSVGAVTLALHTTTGGSRRGRAGCTPQSSNQAHCRACRTSLSGRHPQPRRVTT